MCFSVHPIDQKTNYDTYPKLFPSKIDLTIAGFEYNFLCEPDILPSWTPRP